MIEDKIALVVPTHSAQSRFGRASHYNLAKTFYESYSKFASESFHLYFVYSSYADYLMSFPQNFNISSVIICNESLLNDSKLKFSLSPIITYKFFYGLWHVRHHHKYALVMDDDALFITKVPSTDKLLQIFTEWDLSKRIWVSKM